MSKATKATLKTPENLAFSRKLSLSDGLMKSGTWADRDNGANWPGIPVINKRIRAVISNRVKLESDPTKQKHNVTAANLQRADAAALPPESDTLRLSFSLRVLPGFNVPESCNNFEYEQHIAAVMQDYADRTGMAELAHRYAHNISSGRFFWRNRVGAEAIEIRVTHGDQVWVFDGEDFEIGKFETGTDIEPMASVIAAALAGGHSALLEVEAFVQMGAGQEVFPSQEMTADTDEGKLLYSVDGCAGMHSQKIGNALRSIDTWHPMVAELGAIAAEPYGSVTNRGVAARLATRSNSPDFYSILDNWMIKSVVPAIEQQHFVAAVLIRGGMFGGKGE